MTTEQAAALRETLEAMMDRVARRETIAEELRRLHRLQEAMPPTAPAELKHFLRNRSYTKALQYLKAGFVIEDPDRPDCDEHHP